MTDYNAPPLPFPPAIARPGNAPLTNMGLALRTMTDCMAVEDGAPRLAVLYGPSGYGKTVASTFAGLRTQAARIVAKSIWTAKAMLRDLARELNIPENRRATLIDLYEAILANINAHPRPIIIDEMDYMVRKDLVDLIRDIHDNSNVGIMMIGMEQLPARLRDWEQFHNRIRRFTPAQPASAEDILLLRDHYCHSVAIADDLAAFFGASCNGVVRRIVNNLKEAQDLALGEGLTAIDRAWWGGRPVMTGDVPVRRIAA